MRKLLLVLVFFLAKPAFSQTHYAYWDTITVVLRGIVSDTIWANFPSSPGGYLDLQNTAGPTKPPRAAAVTGYFRFWVISRTDSAGTPDSLTIRWHPREPMSGGISKNDSTFLVGTSGLGGSPADSTDFTITMDPGAGGVAFILRLSDTSVDTTRLILGLDYTSQ